MRTAFHAAHPKITIRKLLHESTRTLMRIPFCTRRDGCPDGTLRAGGKCLLPPHAAGETGSIGSSESPMSADGSPSRAASGSAGGTDRSRVSGVSASVGGSGSSDNHSGGAGGDGMVAMGGSGGMEAKTSSNKPRGELGAGGTNAEKAGTSGGQDANAGGRASDPQGGAGGARGPVCGDGHIDSGEVCDGNCPSACPRAQGCMIYMLTGSPDTCDAECTSAEISNDKAGDGCCPRGANAGTDSDCPASCGDGLLNANEKCEPKSSSSPCPSTCDDKDACTKDMLTGSAAQCTAECAHMPITSARGGDMCCPPGANANTDSDCAPKCGNGIKETGEICDGDCPRTCDDSDPCTEDAMKGAARTCDLVCEHARMIVGAPCGNGKTCSSAGKCEAAATCGNSVVEPGEECESGRTNSWECDSATCKRTGLGTGTYTRFCTSDAQCADAEACAMSLTLGSFFGTTGQMCLPRCSADGRCPVPDDFALFNSPGSRKCTPQGECLIQCSTNSDCPLQLQCDTQTGLCH